MSLTRADFNNPTITNVANPSDFSYHYSQRIYLANTSIYSRCIGPVLNNNPGYINLARATIIIVGNRREFTLYTCLNIYLH